MKLKQQARQEEFDESRAEQERFWQKHHAKKEKEMQAWKMKSADDTIKAFDESVDNYDEEMDDWSSKAEYSSEQAKKNIRMPEVMMHKEEHKEEEEPHEHKEEEEAHEEAELDTELGEEE